MKKQEEKNKKKYKYDHHYFRVKSGLLESLLKLMKV